MHIGIVGAGTASAITILTFLRESLNLAKDLQITCIHDPSTPTAQVGESTSPLVYNTMKDVLGLDFVEGLEEYDGTLRYYTKFFWEDATGSNFSVYYYNPGIHLNSDTWSSYVFAKLKEKYACFSEIHDSVISINQNNNKVTVVGNSSNSHEFDFLIDCRGMPTQEELNSDLYETNVFQSVNSVILFPHIKKYEESNTSSYVHKNGWMFGVPLQHRKAFGYLYNNTLTSYEEAVVNFSELKGIDASTLRNFSWKPYYKKEALDQRILSLGNKLYFMEPQGAIPLHYYELLAEGFITGVLKNVELDRLNKVVNKFNRDGMESIQNLTAFGYCGNTKINSNFWNTIKERARDRLINSKSWQAWMNNVESSNEILGYAPADSSMMKTYIKGFDIDLNKLKNLQAQ